MTLSRVEVTELFVAHNAHVAEVDLLCEVGKQALDANEAVNVEDDEVVLEAHVIQTLLNANVCVVAK